MNTKKTTILSLSVVLTSVLIILGFQNCSMSRFEAMDPKLSSVSSSMSPDSRNLASDGSDSSQMLPSPNPSLPNPSIQESSCTVVSNVVGDATAGSSGPMGSKVTFLITFSSGDLKAQARSVNVILSGSQNTKGLNPVEEVALKAWPQWLNIANDPQSLTVFQVINTGLTPDITSPGTYQRQFEILNAKNEVICKTGVTQVTIVADSLIANFSELVNKQKRLNVNVASSTVSKCTVITQSNIQESTQMVNSTAEAINSYNDCKSKCMNAIATNSTDFTNAKNPKSSGMNGCEFSAPVVFSANGATRATVIRDRIISVVDVGTLHGLGIYSTLLQSQFAKYGVQHWAGVNIFEVLGGTNVFATDMYLDWNVKAPLEVQSANPQSLLNY